MQEILRANSGPFSEPEVGSPSVRGGAKSFYDGPPMKQMSLPGQLKSEKHLLEAALLQLQQQRAKQRTERETLLKKELTDLELKTKRVAELQAQLDSELVQLDSDRSTMAARQRELARARRLFEAEREAFVLESKREREALAAKREAMDRELAESREAMDKERQAMLDEARGMRMRAKERREAAEGEIAAIRKRVEEEREVTRKEIEAEKLAVDTEREAAMEEVRKEREKVMLVRQGVMWERTELEELRKAVRLASETLGVQVEEGRNGGPVMATREIEEDEETADEEEGAALREQQVHLETEMRALAESKAALEEEKVQWERRVQQVEREQEALRGERARIERLTQELQAAGQAVCQHVKSLKRQRRRSRASLDASGKLPGSQGQVAQADSAAESLALSEQAGKSSGNDEALSVASNPVADSPEVMSTGRRKGRALWKNSPRFVPRGSLPMAVEEGSLSSELKRGPPRWMRRWGGMSPWGGLFSSSTERSVSPLPSNGEAPRGQRKSPLSSSVDGSKSPGAMPSTKTGGSVPNRLEQNQTEGEGEAASMKTVGLRKAQDDKSKQGQAADLADVADAAKTKDSRSARRGKPLGHPNPIPASPSESKPAPRSHTAVAVSRLVEAARA